MNKEENIKVEVSFPPWSDAEKSWYLLVDKDPNGWSRGEWFPKKLCSLEPKKDGFTAVLTVPKWLAKIKKI